MSRLCGMALPLPKWLTLGARVLSVSALIAAMFCVFFKAVAVVSDLTWSVVPQAAVDSVASAPLYLFIMGAKYFMSGTAALSFTVFYCDLVVPLALIFFGWIMADNKVHLRNEIAEHVRDTPAPTVDWEMVERIRSRRCAGADAAATTTGESGA